MYLQFKGKRLASILDDLRSVIERRGTIPALSNVLIESLPGGKVRFTATDLDHALQIETDHEGLFEGKTCVSLDRLLGLAKALPEDDLTVTPQENGWAEVKSCSGKYRIAGIPPEDFPLTPTGEAQSYAVRAADLLYGLSEVAPHVSNDAGKPNMCGVLVELNGSVRTVATSGFSLGLCEVKVEQPFLEGTASWFIPSKAVAALRSTFSQAGDVLCWVTDNHLFFRQDSKTLISRRPDATFPEYRPILAELPTERVEFDRAGLMQALDVMAGFAPIETGQTRYKPTTLNFRPDGLTVESKSWDGELATEEVEARAASEFESMVDIHLIRPALKAAGEGLTLLAEQGKFLAFLSETDRAKTTRVISTLRK